MSTEIENQLAELKAKVDAMPPGKENKLSMIVLAGDMDKLLAAMIIATGAGAMGMKVVQFFTFWGTTALRRPQAQAGGKNPEAVPRALEEARARLRERLGQEKASG